jgi:hypothetical protein
MAPISDPRRQSRIEVLTRDLIKLGYRRRTGDHASASAIVTELGLLMAIEAMEQIEHGRRRAPRVEPFVSN